MGLSRIVAATCRRRLVRRGWESSCCGTGRSSDAAAMPSSVTLTACLACPVFPGDAGHRPAGV